MISSASAEFPVTAHRRRNSVRASISKKVSKLSSSATTVPSSRGDSATRLSGSSILRDGSTRTTERCRWHTDRHVRLVVRYQNQAISTVSRAIGHNALRLEGSGAARWSCRMFLPSSSLAPPNIAKPRTRGSRGAQPRLPRSDDALHQSKRYVPSQWIPVESAETSTLAWKPDSVPVPLQNVHTP